MTPAPGNGGKASGARQIAVEVGVGLCLLAIGYFANEVVSHSEEIARLDEKQKLTPSFGDILRAIQEHQRGTHAGVATLDMLHQELREAMSQMEKQQQLRDENLRREISEVKQQLRDMAEQIKELAKN